MYDFPSSPSENQEFTPAGGVTYIYNAPRWSVKPIPGGPATVLPLMDATPAVVGTSLLFARQDHIHPSDTSRSRRPLNINSAMQIAQPNSISNTNPVDGYQFILAGTFGGTTSQQAVPTPGGSLYRMQFAVTAGAAMAAGDICSFFWAVEGYDAAALNWGTASARSILVRLGVRPPVAGTFALAVRNNTTDRSYITAVTFAAGEVGTDVVRYITVPGDVTGTWDKTSGCGLYVSFALACGTSSATAAGAWTAGNFRGLTGQTNGVAATGTWQFFDIAVYDTLGLTGNPPFEVPEYASELRRCMRRWQQCTISKNGNGTAGLGEGLRMMFPVPMRAAPTVVQISSLNTNASSPVYDSITATEVRFYASVSVTGSYEAGGTFSASARL